MNHEIHSNVKHITSGNIPSVTELPKGNLAFGKITADNKYHIYGNVDVPGEPNGKIIEFIINRG